LSRTGESKPRNDASYGDGVWMTRDAGEHWTKMGLGQTAAISRIVIDPRDPRVVLVGALGNPYRDSAQRGVSQPRTVAAAGSARSSPDRRAASPISPRPA